MSAARSIAHEKFPWFIGFSAWIEFKWCSNVLLIIVKYYSLNCRLKVQHLTKSPRVPAPDPHDRLAEDPPGRWSRLWIAAGAEFQARFPKEAELVNLCINLVPERRSSVVQGLQHMFVVFPSSTIYDLFFSFCRHWFCVGVFHPDHHLVFVCLQGSSHEPFCAIHLFLGFPRSVSWISFKQTSFSKTGTARYQFNEVSSVHIPSYFTLVNLLQFFSSPRKRQ